MTIGLGACEVPNEEPKKRDVPPQLTALNENVMNCLGDIELVHFHRSEHCILTAEGLRTTYEEQCEQQQSEACASWSEIEYIYVTAVLESLLLRGRSPEFESLIDAKGALFSHMDAVAMRQLFDECLQMENVALNEQGLRRIHVVILPGIEENQLCIREGYPDFATAPV